MALAFLMLAFAAGGALPVQAGINTRLAVFVGGPIRASMISFAVGTIALVLLALVATRGLVSTGRMDEVPWWGWLGGAVGAGTSRASSPRRRGSAR
jgi:transporter family-2 protein